MRKLALLGLVVIAAIGAFLLIQTRRNGAQQTRPNIRTEQIGRGDLTLMINATGSVMAAQTARLSFKTPGVVAEVFVEEGQYVEEGQIIAGQDNGAAKLLVAQAQANLRVAELTLTQLLTPPAARDIAVAEANVRAAQGAYNALFTPFTKEAIHAAELRYKQAQTIQEDAIKRRKDTGGQYAVETPQYQLALAQEGQATFNTEIARLQLEMLRRGPDARLVSAAKARIDEAKAQLERLQAGLPQAQIERAQLGVEQAKVALESAQENLENTRLRAPFAGIVTSLTAKAGALSASGLPAAIITDTSRLYVNVRIDEIDIGQIKVGQVVLLTFDALPDETLEGKVERIAAIANQDGTVTTYDVRASIDPSKLPVRVGMTASARIIIREVRDVLRVPNLYVRLDRRTNQAYVNVVSGTPEQPTLTEILVTLGLRTEEYSEVVAGLNEGDVIGINLDAGGFSVF